MKKLPDTIPRLTPREAALVVEVAYPSTHSPILYKLKDGTLRANRGVRTAGVTAVTLRSMCRLLDVGYATVIAQRKAELKKAQSDAQKAHLDRAKRTLRAAGYTVAKPKAGKK